MSEYQYYEFLAFDRPLTAKEQAELRTISSRAEITATRFRNEYHWGDLSADPRMLLARYFDAHVYVANWPGWRFCLRLPLDALTEELGKAYARGDTLSLQARGGHWLLSWEEQENEDYDRYAAADGSGWMARLAPLRDEILAGDLRPLYLGWLAAAACGEFDADVPEPPVPPGLDKPSAAQRALWDFLDVDPDWLAAAGEGAAAPAPADPAAQADAFLATLSLETLRASCRQVLLGSTDAGASLPRQFARWRREQAPEVPGAERRTVAELRRLAASAAEARRIREAESAARAKQRDDRKRAQRLAELASDLPAQWREADRLAALTTASGYEQAAALVRDLCDTYRSHGTEAAFAEALNGFLACHPNRPALHRRIQSAGLTGKPTKAGAPPGIRRPGRS